MQEPNLTDILTRIANHLERMEGRDGEDDQLIDVSELSRLMCVSRPTVDRLKAQGKLIEPVKFGTALRWHRGEVRAWLRANCPTAREWEQVKKHYLRANSHKEGS